MHRMDADSTYLAELGPAGCVTTLPLTKTPKSLALRCYSACSAPSTAITACSGTPIPTPSGNSYFIDTLAFSPNTLIPSTAATRTSKYKTHGKYEHQKNGQRKLSMVDLQRIKVRPIGYVA